ncbi:MAG: PilZ domain-containing protein, partial [Acidobacteriota bacterium]|nr:PilZ domain-containing protein [Acidobacteriota bacterium]
HLGRRVFAKLDVKVSWEDEALGEPRTVYGTTENLSGNSTLVRVDILPPVGQPVSLTLYDGKKEIIRIPAVVIRVERDPAKPKAALSIGEGLEKWQEKVLPAAQAWVTRDIKVNYEGDDWLN